MRSLCAALILSGLVIPGAARADRSCPDNRAALPIVIAATVPLVPAELRAYFEALQGVLVGASIQIGAEGAAPVRCADRRVFLDVAAGDGGAASVPAIARSFPRDEDAVNKLYERHGVASGGRLPWFVLERYALLEDAFGKGETPAILKATNELIRACTDVALPLNTTVRADGAVPGNLRLVKVPNEPVGQRHGTVRDRIQHALVARLRVRLGDEVRVWPGRYRNVHDPSHAVFEELLRAFAFVDVLLEADADVMKELQIHNGDDFTANIEEYYARMADRVADVIESRLEGAALLGARLIGSAWAHAGRPMLGQTPYAGDVAKLPTGAAGMAFVGSRNSGLFHHAACSHAKRIKPENIVRFRSAADARQAGRKLCKSCQSRKK